jgi:hypothetical protein
MVDFTPKSAIGNTSPYSEPSSQTSQVVVPPLPQIGGERPSQDLKAESPVCDFRLGCALVLETFPNGAASAHAAITSTPHLAEALFNAGLITNRGMAVAMARAMQEARTSPLPGCICSRSPS